MFSIKNNVITSNSMAYYSTNGNDLYVYYDKVDEFGASLNILTTKSKTYSLVFTFHDKSNLGGTILLSLTKIDDGSIILNITNNQDQSKSFSFTIKGVREIISTIESQTTSLQIARSKADPYLTENERLALPKKLLEHFATLSRVILQAPEPSNMIIDSLKKISNLLRIEMIEFDNIIELNQPKLLSLRQ